MHTGEQARNLWCPMVRMSNGGEDAAENRDVSPEGQKWNSCIASGCAMWRWLFSMADKEQGIRRGYCGLAGRPEGMAS